MVETKFELHFWLDESGDATLNKGSKWFIVACIYSQREDSISEAYSKAKAELVKINSEWINKEMKGSEIDGPEERKIILKEISASALTGMVSRFDTYSAPNWLLLSKNTKYGDTKVSLDSEEREARHLAFPVWCIIEPIKQKISKIIINYDGEKFIENKRLMQELKKHLGGQLIDITYEIKIWDSKYCKGIQLCDVLADAYKRLLGNDKTNQFEIVSKTIKKCETNFSGKIIFKELPDGSVLSGANISYSELKDI